jgi:hypothetical protein
MVKLFLYLTNKAPLHEGVHEGHSFLTLALAVSGQLHAPATLPPEKEFPVPTG